MSVPRPQERWQQRRLRPSLKLPVHGAASHTGDQCVIVQRPAETHPRSVLRAGPHFQGVHAARCAAAPPPSLTAAVIEIKADWISEVSPHFISSAEIRELTSTKGMPNKRAAAAAVTQ